VIRHCTEMAVDRQYVDSHGQSEVAFAFCRLLGFQLLPRLKNIGRQRLYRPVAGEPDVYPHLWHVLTRPIDWELIRQQYDEMVKYATALRLGTAETEAHPASLHAQQHPASHLQSPGRVRQGHQDHLPVPLSARRGTAAGNQRRPPRHRALEQRQRLRVLRPAR
jgi:TnpA family transposase